MKFISRSLLTALLLFLTLFLLSCGKSKKADVPVVRENPAQAADRARQIRDDTPVTLADGLQLTLWASDSLAPDPIAMSIDDEGRIYLTRTNRQKNSEFDIRGHRDWMIPSISLQSVEDRRAFLKKIFAPERSDENKWLTDLNQDGSHDWRDLAVEQDEVWRLEDESGDGIADVSTRILSDFNTEVTDVANALLVRDEDVFVGIGPDMWRVKDTDGDGILDEKKSISTGYAVHIGFSGHGMSGAIEGPDGKIYWGIGDIGANITALDGKKYNYANEGVIVRSNPDGSDFEVFASGLRNTHEFVFDEYGNIISSDNDGDHPGENERLVYIVEGSDAGWRSNWQYGKYTDPKNNTYKVWMDEGLYKPRWEGQAAYIIPPIASYHNGPTGMAYNPGTALGSAWKNKFFLVEFVGNPAKSHIWAFSLKPSGASFELAEDIDVVSGILPTGIKFGPDGALYAADWVNGWGTKNYGRVWKLDVTEEKNDLAELRAQTRQLMQLDYKDQSDERLLELLMHPDMRIRQKAQFELVNRKQKGADIFRKAIAQRDNQLARVHAIWGMGQLAANEKNHATDLLPLLSDADHEIIAQAVKILGDARDEAAATQLVPLLSHENARVRFFAAQALGRIGHREAVPSLIALLEANNDQDLYLRHAAVLALARIGDEAAVVNLAGHASKALRTAAVLVLRRMKSEKVAVFLNDQDEYIATEAARAINDDLSIEGALPQLAAVLKGNFKSEPLLRRGINACLRVGGETELDILIAFAKRSDIPAGIRAEALATIGTWAEPSVLDRVDGRYRGEVKRDPAVVKAKVLPHVVSFLQAADATVLVSVSQMLTGLNISEHNNALARLSQQHPSGNVRAAMINALFHLKHDQMAQVVTRGMQDKDPAVRTAAIGLLNELQIPKEELKGVIDPVLKKGTIKEQQQLIFVLAKMPVTHTEDIFSGLIDQVKSKTLPAALTLDLIEAVDSTHSEKLIAQLQPLRSGNTATGTEAFLETLYGGDGGRGGNYFFTNSTGQCVRCHSIGEYGGTVGPVLTTIADVLSREQLLQALVEPSARIAPGFGNVTVTLDDGQVVTGVLMEENESELILKTSEAEPMEIPLSRIRKRQNLPSSMPPMGTLMSRKEIRDMVEFLSNLKKK